MASSRIEQIIEEIEEYIDSCKFQPLSSTKIVVNKEELEELLRELRMKTPDEIKRYQKIISNKDAILEDAQQKADAIIADANEQAQKIVSESEVMQNALQQSNQLITDTNAQAQDIMDQATEESNTIRMSAIRYTDEMLENLEKIMSSTIESAGDKYNDFMNSIQSCYDVVSQNRSELTPEAEPSSYATEPEDVSADLGGEEVPEEAAE